MSKNSKKINYQLKFDTSKNNLQCFIKRKSLSIVEPEKNQRKRKNQRTTVKSIKKKLPQFQQAKFLTSIIKNAMQQDFGDPKQLSQLLKKMHIQSQQKQQSPINEDDLMKSFQIFKDPNMKLTPQLGFYPQIPMDMISHSNNKEKQSAKHFQEDFSLGKEAQWNNFSTQIQTQIASERSKIEENIDSYPSLLSGYTYLMPNPVYQNQSAIVSQMPLYFSGLSREQRQRKSTPIRENDQFVINLLNSEFDIRTTIMIRHIPNKYSQQMLIDQINQNHKLKYNFFYLPLDSYNPCNVGYAFINFIDAKFISKFYKEWNGKKWTKFNSEKICELAYARIQGAQALIHHFENSNVMHCRDRRYRPFISYGGNT